MRLHQIRTYAVAAFKVGKPIAFKSLDAQIKECSTSSSLETLILSQARDFNSFHCAQALQAMGVLRTRNLKAMQSILDAVEMCNPMPSRDLALSCHSIAKDALLPRLPPSLLKQIERSDMSTYSAQDLSSVMWSLGRLKQSDQMALSKLTKEVSNRPDLSDFKPQAFSNMVWALAKVDFVPDEFLHHVCQYVCTHKLLLREFNAQELSNLIWGLATLGFSPVDNDRHRLLLWRLLCQELETRNLHQDFSSQALANSVWSLAKLDLREMGDVALFKLGQAIVLHKGEFAPAGVSSIVHSLAKLDRNDEAVLNRMCKEILQADLTKFSSNQLGQILYALDRFHLRRMKVLRRITGEMTRRDLEGFSTSSSLLPALITFARLGLKVEPSLLVKFEREFTVLWKERKLSPRESMEWLRGFERLHHESEFLQLARKEMGSE